MSQASVDCWPFGCHVCGNDAKPKLDMPCPVCEDRYPLFCSEPCRLALMQGRTFPDPALFHPDYQKQAGVPVVKH